MSTLGWVVVIVLAAALGFGLGLLRSRSSGKVAEMQRERDAAREELGNYRREVDTHFERTAELFDKVTDDYRELYDHLAVSARRLGAIPGESAETPLARPEQRRLAAEETGTGTDPDPGEAAEDRGTKAGRKPGVAAPDEATAGEPGPGEPTSRGSAPGDREPGEPTSREPTPGEPTPGESGPEAPGEGEPGTPEPEHGAKTGPAEEHEETDDKDKRP